MAKKSWAKFRLAPYKPYGYLAFSEKRDMPIEEYAKKLKDVPFSLLLKEYRTESEKYAVASIKEDKKSGDRHSPETFICIKRIMALEDAIGSHMRYLNEQIEMSQYYQIETDNELTKERESKNVKVSRKPNK